MRDDRPGRADRELLARDLEDERPEGIERRKLVHPGPRPEVRPRVDQLREHRVRPSKELARLRIGNRGSLSRWSVHAHALTSRSVSTLGVWIKAIRPGRRRYPAKRASSSPTRTSKRERSRTSST